MVRCVSLMADEKLSKKEKKEQKRLAAFEQTKQEKRQSRLKWIVIGIGSFLFLAFFIFLVILAKQSSQKTVVLSSSGHVRGAASAPLTLVEFSDFQCPACRAYEPYVEKILAENRGKVKLLYKHFPIKAVHKYAVVAIAAAEAAGRQGQKKFWEMHDVLFRKQDEWANSNNPQDHFLSYAKDLHLDLERFKTDMKDKTIDDLLSSQENEGTQAGVISTPTFFINNKKVELTSFDDLKNAVERELKK